MKSLRDKNLFRAKRLTWHSTEAYVNRVTFGTCEVANPMCHSPGARRTRHATAREAAELAVPQPGKAADPERRGPGGLRTWRARGELVYAVTRESLGRR